jgi:hypothetical protein
MDENDFGDSIDEKKLKDMRSRACAKLKTIQDCYKALRVCRDADVQAGQIPEQGKEWEELVCGPAFPQVVRFWGFKSAQELFLLPVDRRIGYFRQAIAFVEALFGKDAEGLKQILDDIDKIDNKRELRLYQLKSEDIEKEVLAAFAGIV